MLLFLHLTFTTCAANIPRRVDHLKRFARSIHATNLDGSESYDSQSDSSSMSSSQLSNEILYELTRAILSLEDNEQKVANQLTAADWDYFMIDFANEYYDMSDISNDIDDQLRS